MTKRRAYRRIDVKQVKVSDLEEKALLHGSTGTVLGLDIGKTEIVCGLRWGMANFENPWKMANPVDIPVLVELCTVLNRCCDGFTVGMESTGTYGDAVRFALTKAMISVQRVSGKQVSDYKEIFDGVSSQHDGKDAAMIAELTALGKCRLWAYSALSESMQQVHQQVKRMEAYRTQQVQWIGRLEGLLARHWPELTSHLKLGSVTVLKLLERYGSPGNALLDEELSQRLSKWGGTKMTPEKIDRIIGSARATTGITMNAAESQWLQDVAREAIAARKVVRGCEQQLRNLLGKEPSLGRYCPAVGAGTLGVILSTAGDPKNYSSAGALLKALGLNLKEISSGKRIGEKAISKRGPSQARRWIYYWALRGVQRKELKQWYEDFTRVGSKGMSGEHRKMKGLICLMRKLVKSLWHARVHDKEFDYTRVIQGVKRSRRRRRASKAQA